MDNAGMAKFFEKLVKVRREMPVIKKTETAGVGKYSYDYASLDEIQKMLHPILDKYGIYYFHAPMSRGVMAGMALKVVDTETGVFEQFTFEMELGTKEMTYTDKNNRKIVERAGDAYDPQKHGSVHTYFRRYSLVAFFGIVIEGEDDDGATVAKSNRRYNSQKPKKTYDASKHEKVNVPYNKEKFKENQAKLEAKGGGYDFDAKVWFIPKEVVETQPVDAPSVDDFNQALDDLPLN
jgi:hypothetical protein